MRFVFCLTFLVTTLFSFGQETPQAYLDMLKIGDSLYMAHDYKNAATLFSSAFGAYSTSIRWTDRYNAASSWALAGFPDSAFNNLQIIASTMNYSHYGHTATDPDLESLYHDKRWASILQLISSNRFKDFPNLNRKLVESLDSIYVDDQKDRMKLNEVADKFGWNSKEMQLLWKVINYKDSLNLIKIKAILDSYGWLGSDKVGSEGASTLFLVIQHADLATQEKYLPMMRDAVKDGRASASDLALLEDRVALGQGKKQIYGSQISSDSETNQYYVFPLDDPDNVDKRRASVGLQPLANYVSRWQIKWDVEQYKRDLPAIEKKEKSKLK